MIDWNQIAKRNGLSPEDFQKEIFTCAAVVGAMRLDNRDLGELNALKFTCCDDIGTIEVLIRRSTIGGE